MLLQVIDADDQRLRLWAGSAASAIRCRDDLGHRGRTVSVADIKGRTISLSDLYEHASRENERDAVANLAFFKRLMDRQA